MKRHLAALIALAWLAPLPAGAHEGHAPDQFENVQALTRLPWFETASDGRLRLKDRTIGPIVDFHSHLALGFGLPLQVDHFAAPGPTEHYLPIDRPFDLAPYINRNFDEDRLHEMSWDLAVAGLGPGGLRRTHTVPNLVREMEELGIVKSVVLAIDLPVGSDNAGRALAAAHREPKLVPFGSVHPSAPDAPARLDAQAAAGARGLKFHPAVQLVRPDDARAIQLYRQAASRGLLVFFHCGPVGIETGLGRELSQVAHYEKPIAENPEVTFILGHAGALQADQALALAQKYPNVYLELSSQGLPVLRRLLAEAPADRLLFGSDWPFYHAAIPLAKVLIATEGQPELRRKVLYGNAARLLGL